MSIYTEVTGELTRFYSEGEFHEEALKARKEFADYVGILDEENPDDEMKFNQFADWYLFIRPITKYKKTPIELQHEKKLCPLSADKSATIESLWSSRFGLFEFVKIKKSDVYLRDFISGEKLIIKNSDVIHGFDVGVPFSARLFKTADSYAFSSAFCFHPTDALKFIKTEVKRLSKLSHEEKRTQVPQFLLSIMRMRYRYDHFKKVPVNEIYATESRLRF